MKGIFDPKIFDPKIFDTGKIPCILNIIEEQDLCEFNLSVKSLSIMGGNIRFEEFTKLKIPYKSRKINFVVYENKDGLKSILNVEINSNLQIKENKDKTNLKFKNLIENELFLIENEDKIKIKTVVKDNLKFNLFEDKDSCLVISQNKQYNYQEEEEFILSLFMAA